MSNNIQVAFERLTSAHLQMPTANVNLPPRIQRSVPSLGSGLDPDHAGSSETQMKMPRKD